MQDKTCKECKIIKSSDDFYAGRRICKKCRNRQIVARRAIRWKESPEAKVECLEKNKLALREARAEEPVRFRRYAQKYLSKSEAKQKHNEAVRNWKKSEAGREYVNGYNRERYRKDPKYYTMKRLAQRYGVPKGLLKEVWDRDKGLCVLCGSLDKIEFDHVHPVSLGGVVQTSNDLQLLCKPCNLFKSNNLFLPSGGMMKIK